MSLGCLSCCPHAGDACAWPEKTVMVLFLAWDASLWSFQWYPEKLSKICYQCLLKDLHNNHMQNLMLLPRSARMKEVIRWLMLSISITRSSTVSFPWKKEELHIRRHDLNSIVMQMPLSPPFTRVTSASKTGFLFSTQTFTDFQMMKYGLYCIMVSLIPEIQMLQEQRFWWECAQLRFPPWSLSSSLWDWHILHFSLPCTCHFTRMMNTNFQI